MNELFWLIFGIILILIELFIPGLIVIFFGVSAILMAGLIYLGFITNIFYQFFLWSILSIILVLTLRKITIKFYPSLEKYQFSKDSLERKKGIVVEEINPHVGSGRVKISGSYWKAISDDGTIIPVGKEIIVVRQNGLLLYVKVNPN
jgi:membrane protein implicated in regulation of membrane protease activity